MDEADLLSFDEVPPQHLPLTVDDDTSELAESIALHSLLLQFAHPKVRGDFLHGAFPSFSDNLQDLLNKLDTLRVALMPQWHGSETIVRKRTKAAARHLKGILHKSEEMCALNPNVEDRWTYLE